jgi:sensor histidine kinase YesM
MQTLDNPFIFSNQPSYRIARHLLFWGVWWLFFTIIYSSKPISVSLTEIRLYRVSFGVSAVEALLYMPIHIIYSYAIIYLLIPAFLLRNRYLSFLTGVVIFTFLAAIVSHLITYLWITPYRLSQGTPPPLSSFFFGLMAGLRGGLQTGGFAAAIVLLKHFYMKQQANQQLEREKLTAELQLLKSQVHPHFLFNTLNHLYALTLTSSGQAPDVVLKLSGLLSYMLYECDAPKVLVSNEIKLVQTYIELEKMRYGDRVDIAVNVRGNSKDKLIAPLLLIPFIENSFKHGVSEQLDQAWITLDILIKNDTLTFKLINSTPELEQPYNPKIDHSERIGLKNVKKRLDLIYPGQYELKISKEGEVFMVTLSVTLEPSSELARKTVPAYVS